MLIISLDTYLLSPATFFVNILFTNSFELCFFIDIKYFICNLSSINVIILTVIYRIFMDNRRKEQLLNQANSAYKGWTKKLSAHAPVSEIDNILEQICKSLAFGTIIVSGRHNPASYIGTSKQCKGLKEAFGGQVGAISNNWYWIGYASADDIRRKVSNPLKNFQVSVLENDVADATLNLGEVASLDIKYGFKECDLAVYIGGYMVCILLKRQLGGKIGKKYNHWYWKGNASFSQIDTVRTSYQKVARRYRRKKIILTI